MQASNFVADRLEEAGEADAANDIRQVGDLIEENIGLAVDATACAGSVAAGAGIVSAISALATPACMNTATGVFNLVSDAVDNDGGQACPEGATPISDAAVSLHLLLHLPCSHGRLHGCMDGTACLGQ